MTQLRFENILLKAADLGEENCLPDIMNNKYIHTPIRVTDRIPAGEGALIGKGMISTLLPYCIQDGYDRNRKEREFQAAILENEYLKATFLPCLGGRLWSLYYKKAGKELLYRNAVFQPANLSLRNAWFSGGVEWNVGIKGHNPLTCSPLFACRCTNVHGEPVLKMYEYERIRGVVYSVCATLKEDVLLVHPVIENREAEDKYMYWWSNIAVDEQEGMRILAPTRETFVSYYDETGYVLDYDALPVMQIKGMEMPVDVSYPERIFRSGDFFYNIPKGQKKWVAAVDREGSGLMQFSDDILQGRKLFIWGRQQGGRHWNEWLSDGYKPYVEIQAGLLKTQLEHFIMEKESVIQWTEGYCGISGEKDVLHGQDYSAATAHLEAQLGEKYNHLSEGHFEIVHQEEPAYLGSGWGALENRIRNVAISDYNAFPEASMNAQQEDWISLLEKGELPQRDVLQPILSYVAGDFWEKLLREHLQERWYDYYQLGVICCAKCRFEEAMDCFRRSQDLEANPWALRCMAQIEKSQRSDTAAAAELMCSAVALKDDYRPLLCDCADALIADGQYQRWLEIYSGLSPELRENGRLTFFTIVCLIKTGQLEQAAALLTEELVVCDIKEGEYSISQLWVELYRLVMAQKLSVVPEAVSDEAVLERYPLPYTLDYRMH